MSKNSSMSKNSRTKLKLLSSVTAISLISVSVMGTHTTEVSANPFARLWSRIRSAANNLTRYNPFKTSSKSFNLNKPSSNGKLSSPQVTTQQGFKQNFGDGSDVIITSNNQNESSTSSNKQNKNGLFTKFKGFFTTSGGSKPSKISAGNTNTAFESNEDVTTTTHQTNWLNDIDYSTVEGRKNLLKTLYEESSDIFVTGNRGDIEKNRAHYNRLRNENNPKTQPPVSPKKHKLTVNVDIHTTSTGSSSSSNNNK